jgi:uridine kinase
MVKAAGSFAEFAKNYDLDVPQALELELMSEHIKELLNGKSVFLPKYDMSGTAIRHDNHTLANPSKIIISEGLFTLTEKIKDAFEFKIYVDVRANVQKDRFFVRAEERGLGESANGIYKNASQKAEIYIRPCKEEADIVLSGEAVRARYKAFLNRLISIVQQENFRNKVIL